MSRASAKGAIFSLEALLAILAATALLYAASLHSASPAPSLTNVYEYQVLNDFLEVRSKAPLTSDYAAESGFCLRLEQAGNTEYLPGSCAHSTQINPVSTTRIVASGTGFTELKATLWKP